MQDDDQDVDSDVENSPEPEEGGDEAMDDAALAQSEIDDLFGISSDEAPQSEGIHALINSPQVPHRRMPVLDACFDRLVHTLSKSLRSLTSGDVEISLAETCSVRFGNYIEKVPLPALISVFKVVEWNDHGLINVDSALIYAIIDVMLGGRQATPPLTVETRSFTAIEVKLIKRMIELILKEITTAFKPVIDVEFQLERMEPNPSLVDIASPPSLAVLFTIDVHLNDRSGRIQILIPYATLEPMSDLLDRIYA
ncbi:MAG: flagellar motor switch protein FliM, partial [Geminicoccaceae bacterium]